MIIHIFTANRIHLVPNIIEGFLKYTNINDQYFLLVGDKSLNKDVYIDLFSKFGKSNYKLLSSFNDLKREGKKFKKDSIILHGVPYKWMAFFVFNGFKDVKWICWGSGARINKSNWKSILFTPIKKIIYNRLSKVGVLMPQDAISLKNDFKLTNISLLSYFGTIDLFPFTEDHIKLENSSTLPKNVYLGNNSACIKTYLPLCNKLSKFKNDITVNCMLNYSFKKSVISQTLEKEGHRIYGNKFFMDTKLYPIDEYYNYMNNCDIYICDVDKQSGLGAIFTCLRLGKKLFLSGINYEWMKTLGCKVFHTKELDQIDKDNFLCELSLQDKINNYNIINSYLDLEKILINWYNFTNISGK